VTRVIKAVRKYLEGYAEPETELATRIQGSYQNAVVIPVRAERDGFLEHVFGRSSSWEGVLAIVVVNGAADSSPSIHAANEETTLGLRARGRSREIAPSVFLLEGALLGGGSSGRGPDVLVIDRASEAHRLPAKQGVGLARKIGCDLALALHEHGSLESEWIHTTDADASQPATRFMLVEELARDARQTVAAALPFTHVAEERHLEEAGALYEIGLRWYVLGLRAAGSSYAYHSIGSTIAVRSDAYSKVRGFPKRLAGEDFYFLNKLAKVGSIARPPGERVEIRARASDRTPFGTGRALAKIREATSRGEVSRVYHPACFKLLRRWLRTLEQAPRDGLRAAAHSCAPREAIEKAVFFETIESLGAPAALDSLRARYSETGLPRAFHTWFDAFRTLKFVHAVRDLGFANVEWREAARALCRSPRASGWTAASLCEALRACDENGSSPRF
jgi:hypothetical protein